MGSGEWGRGGPVATVKGLCGLPVAVPQYDVVIFGWNIGNALNLLVGIVGSVDEVIPKMNSRSETKPEVASLVREPPQEPYGYISDWDVPRQVT